jgi:minor extracellular serine protease Vpr
VKTKISLAISAALLSSATFANTEYTANKYGPELQSADTYKKPIVKPTNVTSPQRFIIELSSPALAKYKGNIGNLSATAVAKKGDKLNVQSSQAKSYISHLAQEQNNFASSLKKVSANTKIERQFNTVFNGVTVVGQGLSIKQLMALPGVKAVYPETMYEVNMDASHERINSEAIWNAVNGMENAGKGIRVAVIDGGIRPENPMFADDGFTAPTGAMPTDDYCSTVDTTFCNNKLIVARWSQPTDPVCADEYMSPLGYGGHGTHVAGTAVGNKVDITYKGNDVTLSGVAPAAYLMAYKALYSPADCGQASGSNIMLMEAFEHAVKDGADVINNSWGGGPGGDPANSPYKTMFEAAEAAGVIVVTAAGNDGDKGAKTIGCPACIESGITVANSTTGRFFANGFTVNGEDFIAVPGSDSLIEMDITAPIINAKNIDADNFQGCDPFAADSFKDGIALISRGACNFSDKAEHALAAGAKAVVVYNNTSGAPFTMSLPGMTFPSVMISDAAGATIIEAMGDAATQGTISPEIKRIVDKTLADTINASSSRGPNGNENILKPDLAAPGTDILSAFSPDEGGEDFNSISGTSMASPHVAGAAALMRQLHPDWTAVDIKTALTSTATINKILEADAATPATPFAMGAGRMDLDAAAKAVLTFDKPSVAADSCIGPCTFVRTVYNKSSEKTSWNLSASADTAGITVSPSTLELEAGASATFTVTVDSTFSEYGEWIFGNIMIESNDGKQDAHLPVAVMAKEASDSNLLSTYTADTDITTADAFEVKTVLNNSMFKDAVTLTATAPKGTKLTSKDDVSVSKLSNATQHGLTIDDKIGVITWVGKLALPEIAFDKSTGTYQSVFDKLSIPVCDAGCDEKSFNYPVSDYMYNGQSYNKITISSNGLVIVGGGNTSGTWDNKSLPDSANPNNILAPFWSDLDLTDSTGAAGDTGGGQFGIQELTSGTDTYIVVEWKDVQVYDDASNSKYSFSIWIKAGDTQDISFNYYAIPNMPEKVTIGAENIAGTVGSNHYYNGAGSVVAANDYLQVTSSTAGQVELSYKVKATETSLLQADAVEVLEDDKVTANALTNDTVADRKVARTQVTGNGITAKAQRLIDVAASGTLTKAKIVTEPTNGKVVMTETGEFTYTPNANYVGTDSFSYSAVDGTAIVSAPATVAIKVNNVNDAPTVAPVAVSVTQGTSVTVNANGTDIDSARPYSYVWTQTAGESVTFANGTDAISFVAPTTPQTLTFSVTASDGELTSAPKTVNVTVKATESTSSGGGSMGWLTMLLLPLAALRRRKS